MSHSDQKVYKLQPVHKYTYEGVTFDVSKITTEKLRQSVKDKRNLFWWHQALAIRSKNAEVNELLRLASTVSENDILNLLWNNYCLFEIERTSNIPATIMQNDPLGAWLCFSNCLEFTVNSILVKSKIFISSKKRGVYLREVSPDAYNILHDYSVNFTVEGSIYLLNNLREILVSDLIAVGFLKSEIDAWDKHHLERFLHQAM